VLVALRILYRTELLDESVKLGNYRYEVMVFHMDKVVGREAGVALLGRTVPRQMMGDIYIN